MKQGKKLLRVLVLVLLNLLTLPWQLALLALVLVSERTKTETESLNEYVDGLFAWTKQWIQTGKLIQTTEEEPE